MILTGGKLSGEYEVKASKDALKELKTRLEEETLPAWQKGGAS